MFSVEFFFFFIVLALVLHPHRCYHIIFLDPTVTCSYIITYPFLCFSGSSICGNADFQKAAPQISQLLEMLRSSRQQLTQLWHSRKSKLEQCFQLRIFEADIEKVCLCHMCSGTIHYQSSCHDRTSLVCLMFSY